VPVDPRLSEPRAVAFLPFGNRLLVRPVKMKGRLVCV
jgi:hypothetical protein